MKSTASEPGLDVDFLRPFFELQLCMNLNKTRNKQDIFWKIYLKLKWNSHYNSSVMCPQLNYNF